MAGHLVLSLRIRRATNSSSEVQSTNLTGYEFVKRGLARRIRQARNRNRKRNRNRNRRLCAEQVLHYQFVKQDSIHEFVKRATDTETEKETETETDPDPDPAPHPDPDPDLDRDADPDPDPDPDPNPDPEVPSRAVRALCWHNFHQATHDDSTIDYLKASPLPPAPCQLLAVGRRAGCAERGEVRDTFN